MTRLPYLLDTGILVALVRAGPLGRYIRVTFELDDPVVRSMVSIVSHGEILVLAIANRSGWGPAKEEALGRILDDLVTLDIRDLAVLAAYVELDPINKEHPDGARVLSSNDRWIAATAKASGAILLTEDKDFLHLDPGYCKVQYVDQKSRLAERNGEQP